MKVRELIEDLQKMPQESNISILYDGVAGQDVNIVYVANSGKVILADFGQACYDDEDRPKSAPTKTQNKYWQLPEKEDMIC